MKYKIMCHKCKAELEIIRAERYLGKDKDGFDIPTTEVVVGQCHKCIGKTEIDTIRMMHCAPKHGW